MEPYLGGIVRLRSLRSASANVVDRTNVVGPLGMAAISTWDGPYVKL